MAESRQEMVIAAESECKYNKWQRSFWSERGLFNADGSISSPHYCVQYNEVCC